MTVRVVVVDDQELVRAGLRMVLDPRPEVEVVGEAADGQEALEVVGRLAPDVVLMDVRMPRMSGVDATREIRRRGGPRVLVLTTFDEDDHVVDALHAGAAGFLVKDTPVDELVAAVLHVHEGDAVISPSTTRRLVERALRAPRDPGTGPALPLLGPDPRLGTLTPREREVLVLVGQGLSNAEVAERLTLGEVTVKTHVSHLLAKLGARDRVQLVVAAHAAGLVGGAHG
jgi:DNA-binding NarL/FixJ family response regulator